MTQRFCFCRGALPSSPLHSRSCGGMSSRRAPLCVVCGTPKKYKCPSCMAPYCSAPCFAAHKPVCVPSSRSSESQGAAAQPNNDSRRADDLAPEDGVTLSEAEFRALESNIELCASLRDPALQRALRAIDSAPDRERALADAATDGRMRDFLDAVLLAMGKAQRHPSGLVEFTG
jgi:zinc finger HIT domain-containing protein 3